jgi:glycosyltransferase 2 family protein
VNKRLLPDAARHGNTFLSELRTRVGAHKHLLIGVGKYGLAVGLLTWVVLKHWAPESGKGLGYVWQRHVVKGQPIHEGFLAAALGLYATALLLTLFRWYILVRAQELPFRISDALRLGMVGFFFNTFLPGSVGGDLVKAAALARGQSRRTVAVATVVMDRVIALWALVWFVALSGAVFWASGLLEGSAAEDAKLIVSVAAAVVGGTLAAWMVLGLLPAQRAERFAGRLERLPAVGGSAAEFWRAVWMYRCKQRSVAGVMVLSWVGHVGFVLAFYCSAHVLWSEELGAIPTLAQHFLLVPIGLVIQSVPLTPGGAGFGEWGFGKLYGLFAGETAETNGVLASLVQRVLGWVLGIPGFVVYARMRTLLPETRSTAEPAVTAVLVNGEAGRQPEVEATSAS